MKIKIDHGDVKGMREFVLAGTSLRAYLIKRDETPSSINAASVYILMDHRRNGFYIGETGETSGGGFYKRFNSHKSGKKEKWWELALCFTDTSDLFSDERTRKWIESQLNSIARDERHLVLSTAAVPSVAPSHAEDKLWEILGVCWLLGIPWGSEDYAKQSGALPNTAVPTKKAKCGTGGKWNGKTQLARLIAQCAKKPRSVGTVLGLLGDAGNKSRRRCGKGSVWRKPLEDAGVKFDENGYVSDWTCAKNPL